MMCLASRQGRGEFQRITRRVLELKVLTSSRHAAEQAALWQSGKTGICELKKNPPHPVGSVLHS